MESTRPVILHKLWSLSKIYICVRNFITHANAILQLVDPAYAAMQEHAKT